MKKLSPTSTVPARSEYAGAIFEPPNATKYVIRRWVSSGVIPALFDESQAPGFWRSKYEAVAMAYAVEQLKARLKHRATSTSNHLHVDTR
jgi:hypothetical protein